jgi:hypothetical protein
MVFTLNSEVDLRHLYRCSIAATYLIIQLYMKILLADRVTKLGDFSPLKPFLENYTST